MEKSIMKQKSLLRSRKNFRTQSYVYILLKIRLLPPKLLVISLTGVSAYFHSWICFESVGMPVI